MGGATAAYLDGDPDGRLHLQHGPIDLVIGTDGGPAGRESELRATVYAAARRRFFGRPRRTGHGTDASEISRVASGTEADRPRRAPDGGGGRALRGRNLHHADGRRRGAVADEILAAMLAACDAGERPARLYVNNGGDIALHLDDGARFALAIAREDGADLGRFAITAADPTRGIATSGRGGRSLSRGIADSVTILARSAAEADAAATIVGNAVDLPGNPAIHRAPADTVVDDSDLGDRAVVVGVDALSDDETAAALCAGEAEAERLVARGLVHRAALFLGRHGRVVAPPPPPFPPIRKSEAILHA